MALEQTLFAFLLLAGLYALLPASWRTWALFLISVTALYWLQPDLRIRWLDFFLPTLTILLTISTWFLIRASNQPITREDWIALGLALGLVLLLSLMRYVPASYRYLVASRPPAPGLVGIVLLGALLLTIVISRLPGKHGFLLLLLITLFGILKTEALATAISHFLRTSTGQDASLASSLDLNWLGFSYVAFRLIHLIRDRQTGLLPALTLREHITYITFFPAFLSGPIDRAERMVEDLRNLPVLVRVDATRYGEGAERIISGLVKKFVIADTLAQGMTLDAFSSGTLESSYGAWLLLYGYALRLYFDFSGYSDIAIGTGLLFGVRLPENFNYPYFRTNITAFWQSWHMTLSNWARFYVFSPLSRHLLRRKPKPSSTLVVLITQISTMLVIGLWHGVTINFIIWGLWHGIGLWIHKQWSDRTRKWYRGLNETPYQKWAWQIFAGLITFHYVVLGWVWFALPDVSQSIHVFAKLFGI